MAARDYKSPRDLIVLPISTPIAFSQTSYDEFQRTNVGATLKASGGNYGGGTESLITVPAETDNGTTFLVRKLTPTECASLQGFEKDWCSLIPHKDTPEYKMWGNGMAFPCMLYIMEGVQEILQRRYLNSIFGGENTG